MAPKRRRSEPSAPAAAHRVRLAGEESALASKLSTFRKQGKLTDVTVRASGTDFAAHRNVLAAASSYFDARFGSGMRDSDDAVVVLDDVPSAVFECVLDFVYDGACEVEEGALPAVLEAAARLQVAALQEAAVAAASARLGASSALAMWGVGDRLTLPGLVEAAAKAAATNFDAIAAGEALLQASHAQLLALLQDEDLASTEEIVFSAVSRWADHVRPAEADLLALLQHVRFGCLPAAYLQSTVRAWPPMAGGPAKDILFDALTSLCPGGTPLKARKPPPGPAIEWQSFAPNLVITAGEEGETVLTRASAAAYDVALGSAALTAGRHEWLFSMRKAGGKYVGVALADCPKNGRASSSIWCVRAASFAGTTSPVTLRVVLDMDARTLSVARNGDELELTHTDLPASVHPFLCCGSTGEQCRVRQAV